MRGDGTCLPKSYPPIEGASHEPFQILHRQADLRRRAVPPHPGRRPAGAEGPAGFRISGSGAAADRRPRRLSGCLACRHRRNRRCAHRGVGQWRRRHALYEFGRHRRRPDDPDRHLQARHQSGPGPADGAEPGQPGRGPPAGRRARPGHHYAEKPVVAADGRSHHLAQRPLRRQLPAQLRPAAHQGPPPGHQGRRADPDVRRRRLRHAHLAGSAEGRRTRPVAGRCRRRHPLGKTSRQRPALSAARPPSPT